MTMLAPIVKVVWSRIIKGQIEELQSCQLLSPPLTLAVQTALVVSLPHGKIEIINSQRRQRVLCISTVASAVQHGQFPAQGVHGPSVHRNVMKQQQQDLTVIG